MENKKTVWFKFNDKDLYFVKSLIEMDDVMLGILEDDMKNLYIMSIANYEELGWYIVSESSQSTIADMWLDRITINEAMRDSKDIKLYDYRDSRNVSSSKLEDYSLLPVDGIYVNELMVMR